MAAPSADPSPATAWLDAGPFLAAVAARGLARGELLAGESFDLFSAMNAIEVGDPKMDVGAQRRRDPGTPEALAGAGAAPATLPPAAALRLADALLAAEASWHAGATLPQTLGCSLYFLLPGRLAGESPALAALATGMRCAAAAAVAAVVAGQVCEDEDFSAAVFGFAFEPGEESPDALRAAARALDDAAAGLDGGGAPAGVADALRARLRFRALVLRVFAALLAKGGIEPGRELPALAEAGALCARAAELADALPATAHLGAGAPPAGAAGADDGEALRASVPGFVPDLHLRHMGAAPPRPVRLLGVAAAAAHWAALLRGLGRVCGALRGAAGWPDLRWELQRFGAAAAGAPAGDTASALVRSAMHLQLVAPLRLDEGAAPPAAAAGGGAAPVPEPPPQQQQQQQQRAAPPAPPLPPYCPSEAMIAAEFGLDAAAPPCADTGTFLAQCAVAVQGWAHTMCLNRCRQRRRLRRLLEDWRNMADHAAIAGGSPALRAFFAAAGWRLGGGGGQPPPQPQAGGEAPADEEEGPLAMWVRAEAAACQLAHLAAGLPLELYAPAEVAPVAWYCTYLAECVGDARRALAAARPAAGAPPPAAARRKRGAKAPPPPPPTAAQREEALRGAVAAAALEMERLMCQAAMQLALAVDGAGLGSPPAPPLGGGAAERFEQRFGCFAACVVPAPLDFETWADAVGAGAPPPARLLAAAAETYAAAQRAAGGLLSGGAAPALRPGQAAHLAAASRAAAQNCVAAQLLARALAAAGGGVPALRAAWDPAPGAAHCATGLFFPVLTLRSAK